MILLSCIQTHMLFLVLFYIFCLYCLQSPFQEPGHHTLIVMIKVINGSLLYDNQSYFAFSNFKGIKLATVLHRDMSTSVFIIRYINLLRNELKTEYSFQKRNIMFFFSKYFILRNLRSYIICFYYKFSLV